MITQVDSNGKFAVQKVTKFIKGELVTTNYQVVELPAGDSSKVRSFATLQAARLVIGKTMGGKAVH